MIKYYDIGGGYKFSLEKTTSGYFKLNEVIPIGRGMKMKVDHMFSNELEALKEILSFAEIEKDDFEDEE